MAQLFLLKMLYIKKKKYVFINFSAVGVIFRLPVEETWVIVGSAGISQKTLTHICTYQGIFWKYGT